MNKEKKDFFEKLVHDIRTPLAVIQSYLRLDPGRDYVNDADIRDFHKAAVSSVQKITKLIDSVKDFDSNSGLKKSICDISATIRNVFMEIKLLADEKEIELQFIGPDHLLGFVEPLSLERVIQNLVKNAIQASNSDGEKFIEVRLLQKDLTVLIDVRDNGCGIACENLERIFVKGVTIGDHNGTGIGLDYCKEVVEKHGGSIAVHSRLNKGTLFSVVLPKTAVAVCNIFPHFLQVWASDDNDKRVELWIDKWRQSHLTSAAERVSHHCYMMESEGDSIDYC